MATSMRWAVLLTSFKAITGTPQVRTRQTKALFDDLFVNRNKEGLHDFWVDQSGQNIDLVGTTVFDWTEMPFTVEQFKTEFPTNKRSDGIAKIAKEFAKKVDLRPFFALIVIVDEKVGDTGAHGTTVVVNGATKSFPTILVDIDVQKNFNLLGHEMSHNLGLNHSLDMSAANTMTGEYMDPWDIVGGESVDANGNLIPAIYAYAHARFERGGPGLVAPQMEKKNWFGNLQVMRMSIGDLMTDSDKRAITLSPLTRRKSATEVGAVAIRLDYKDKLTNQMMAYWVETRTKENWDKGIPGSVVLIHRDGPNGIRLLVPDLDEPNEAWKAGQIFVDEENNIKIIVHSIYGLGADIIIEPFVSTLKTIPQVLGGAKTPLVGAGIAIASIASATQKDLVVMTVENANEKNKIGYRVGFNVDLAGNVVANPMIPNSPGWSALKNGPDIGSWENQGLGLAIGDVTGNQKLDMVVAYIDNPAGMNQIYYTMGADMDAQGNVLKWTAPVKVPILTNTGRAGSTNFENAGCGAALADISGNGKLDLILVYIENHPEANKAYYIIGWDMKADGTASSWSDKHLIPNFGNWENQGCGVSVYDVTGNGKLDLLFYYIDNPNGSNKAYYSIGYDLTKDGFPQSWSKPIQVPGTIGVENQTGSMTIGKLNGLNNPSMFALSVEQTTAMPILSYRFVKEIETRNDTR